MSMYIHARNFTNLQGFQPRVVLRGHLGAHCALVPPPLAVALDERLAGDVVDRLVGEAHHLEGAERQGWPLRRG